MNNYTLFINGIAVSNGVAFGYRQQCRGSFQLKYEHDQLSTASATLFHIDKSNIVASLSRISAITVDQHTVTSRCLHFQLTALDKPQCFVP